MSTGKSTTQHETVFVSLNPVQARILEDLVLMTLPRTGDRDQRRHAAQIAFTTAPFSIRRSYSTVAAIDDVDVFRVWLLRETAIFGLAGSDIDSMDDEAWERRCDANRIRARFCNVGILTEAEASEMRA
jgi:hypothetical protein